MLGIVAIQPLTARLDVKVLSVRAQPAALLQVMCRLMELAEEQKSLVRSFPLRFDVASC